MKIRLGSWFPGSVHGDLNGLGIGSDLERHRADLYSQGERLSSSATSNESKIVELRDLVLHDRGAISQLAATILIVTSSYGDQCTVADLVEGDDREGHGQRLI